jgi:hypothetical protein
MDNIMSKSIDQNLMLTRWADKNDFAIRAIQSTPGALVHRMPYYLNCFVHFLFPVGKSIPVGGGTLRERDH